MCGSYVTLSTAIRNFFNLSLHTCVFLLLFTLGYERLPRRGHGEAIAYVKSLGLPLMVLGGGGYTIKNVARCWTHETGVLLGEELAPDLPFNEYYQVSSFSFLIDFYSLTF